MGQPYDGHHRVCSRSSGKISRFVGIGLGSDVNRTKEDVMERTAAAAAAMIHAMTQHLSRCVMYWFREKGWIGGSLWLVQLPLLLVEINLFRWDVLHHRPIRRDCDGVVALPLVSVVSTTVVGEIRYRPR